MIVFGKALFLMNQNFLLFITRKFDYPKNRRSFSSTAGAFSTSRVHKKIGNDENNEKKNSTIEQNLEELVIENFLMVSRTIDTRNANRLPAARNSNNTCKQIFKTKM